MEDRNGLNDIILNKSSKNNSTKKILLTIATFAIILIIVVVVMNQFSGTKETNLPHAPEVKQVAVEEVIQEPAYQSSENDRPETAVAQQQVASTEAAPLPSAEQPVQQEINEPVQEPLFEEPEIIEEPDYTTTAKPKATPKPVSKPAPSPVVKKEEKQVLKAKPFRPSGKYDPESKSVVNTATSAAEAGQYYVQVGSFAKYAPSKSFLDKIGSRGYTYTFHKVTRNGRTINKVLVGPFRTQSAAREALPVIRKNVEPGAFLIKL